MKSPTLSAPSLEKSPCSDAQEPLESHGGIEDFGPAPDGGIRAWLSTAGAFSIFFSCLGFTSCFGVLLEYYGTHQLKDHTADEIAWIGSLSSFIQFAGGAIGGPMFDRFGTKVSD